MRGREGRRKGGRGREGGRGGREREEKGGRGRGREGAGQEGRKVDRGEEKGVLKYVHLVHSCPKFCNLIGHLGVTDSNINLLQHTHLY